MANNADAAFVKTLQKRAGGKKGEEKFRNAENSFGSLDVPDGTYAGKLSSVRYGLDKQSNPYVQFRFVLTRPLAVEDDKDVKVKGKTAPVFRSIKDTKNQTATEKLEWLSRDFQNVGVDVQELDPGEVFEKIPQICKDLSNAKDKVECKLRVTSPDNPQYDKNVNIMGVIESSSQESDEKEDDDEDDEEEDDDENEGDDNEAPFNSDNSDDDSDDDDYEEDDDDSDDEDDDEQPEVGDVYYYTGKKGTTEHPCEVTAVSALKETVTLRRQKDDKKFTKVSWDDLGEKVENDEEDDDE